MVKRITTRSSDLEEAYEWLGICKDAAEAGRAMIRGERARTSNNAKNIQDRIKKIKSLRTPKRPAIY